MSLVKTLSAGLAAAAALLVASWPDASHAQTPQKLRVQASFPPSSIVMDGFKIWTERVKTMSGGRLEIEGLAGRHGVAGLRGARRRPQEASSTAATPPAAYWVGKNRARRVCSAPTPGGPFGMDEHGFHGLAATRPAGSNSINELYQKSSSSAMSSSSRWLSVGNQAFGWFAKPITSWEDLKGRKCRQTGINAELFGKGGMGVVNMPGGEIVPAAERGVIECAEWASPADDMKIGFHTVWKHYYLPSVHEPAPILEVLINGDVYKKLAPDLQQIMKTAAWEATVMQRLMTQQGERRSAGGDAQQARRSDPPHAQRHPQENPGDLGRDGQGRGSQEPLLQEGLRQPEGLCGEGRADAR